MKLLLQILLIFTVFLMTIMSLAHHVVGMASPLFGPLLEDAAGAYQSHASSNEF